MAGVTGTGLFQPPITLLNTMDAITQKHILATLGDVTFQPSPVLWAMNRRGKKFGEGSIVYPIVTQEELTGGAFWGDQLLNTSVVDSVIPAEQQWRSYYQAVTIPINDIKLNRGGNSVDVVKTKFQIASASMLQKLSRAMWGTAPQNTSIDIDNIPNWVFSTSNTIAGINRSSVAAWQPAQNFPNGGSPLTVTNAEAAYQSVVFGFDEPDLFTMTNTSYGAFKAQFTSATRFIQNWGDQAQDKEALQMGFRYHFLFNNALVTPDRFNTATQGFLLNTKYLYPVFHIADYFTADPWLKPSNQRVITTTMYLTWQLICLSPRMQVCITGM